MDIGKSALKARGMETEVYDESWQRNSHKNSGSIATTICDVLFQNSDLGVQSNREKNHRILVKAKG